MRRLAFVVLATALACGSDPEPQINPAMLGTWTGQSTIAASGFALAPRPSTLTVKADGPRVSVSGLCPDGMGSIFQALGEGDTVTWYGPSLACPFFRSGDCQVIMVTYTGLTLRLAPNSLEVDASGVASGCGITGSMTEAFIGSRYRP